MDAIVILGFGLAGVTLVLTAWTVINRNKAETENDALTRAVLRLYDKQIALEKEVLQLQTVLNQLQTNAPATTKKAPPRPVPPKKYVSENDSWLDIPVAATAATATATALGAGAMSSGSGSSDSWDCGDSFGCGGE